MGEMRVNLTNFVSVGLMAFIGVWAINKALDKFGKPDWKA